MEPLSKKLGLTIEETAYGIIRLANELATNVIRVISVQRGYDPREFALLAHGGAGPMFAPFIAEELNIRKIIVPFIPAGVFNAWGMLNLDVIHDATETRIMKLTINESEAEQVSKIIEELRNKIIEDFRNEGIDETKVKFEYYIDMRYYGQEYTLRIPTSYPVTLDVLRSTIRAFENRHYLKYGFKLEGNLVEFVNFYVKSTYSLPKPEIKQVERTGGIDKALIEEREVYMGNNKVIRVPIYSKELLPTNTTIQGPAIIEENTATIIVLEGWKAVKDKYGNIVLSK
ncbi:MAG: hydantoinase/oxoprolinase family protein [Vulcanisaeta sp.]|uniref:hydantoinase/oxoprolinase family protein n=1 Tax=Vulcanisaeta sp. TaxID=2020871 RepID=UPI003D102B89